MKRITNKTNEVSRANYSWLAAVVLLFLSFASPRSQAAGDLSSDTRTRGSGLGSTGFSEPHRSVHVHPEAEFCKVVLVPVEVPTSKVQIKQSSDPFTIAATYAANVTNAQRVVFDHAVGEWEAIILTRGFTPAAYPIEFSNGPLGGNTLARATVMFDIASGDLVSTDIVFDNDGSTTWFEDPTPGGDSEFDGTPPAGHDLLSVARHEIGHGVGWASTARVTDLTTGGIFDGSRLNIATVTTGGCHADAAVHVADLMVPTIGVSMRRPISEYPASALVARAFHYDITMGFVDPGYGGAQSGSANQPWDTFAEGLLFTPTGYRLLLVPATYQEAPCFLFRRMTVIVARGGAARIAGP